MTAGMRFDGYVYELGGDALDWQDAGDGLWRIGMSTRDDQRAVSELGRRWIGDSMCIVFLCADARVRALRVPAAAQSPEARR